MRRDPSEDVTQSHGGHSACRGMVIRFAGGDCGQFHLQRPQWWRQCRLESDGEPPGRAVRFARRRCSQRLTARDSEGTVSLYQRDVSLWPVARRVYLAKPHQEIDLGGGNAHVLESSFALGRVGLTPLRLRGCMAVAVSTAHVIAHMYLGGTTFITPL